MKSLNFPKQERLKSRKSIASLFSHGKSFHIYPIRVLYIRTPKKEIEKSNQIRCAFSVPKRRFKKTVDRNKIKRKIREIIRLDLDKLVTGKDIIIITLPEIKEKTYQDIEKAINSNLKRLKLYK